jgi:hypothetical protein
MANEVLMDCRKAFLVKFISIFRGPPGVSNYKTNFDYFFQPVGDMGKRGSTIFSVLSS